MLRREAGCRPRRSARADRRVGVVIPADVERRVLRGQRHLGLKAQAASVALGPIQVTIVLLVEILLFRVPMAGDIVDLYLASLLFIAATLGLGLTISTIAHSQFQAVRLTLFVFLPSMLLSGFMFPFDGMPAIAQWIGWLLPLTHFMDLVRGIMLRGAELGELTRSVVALLVFFCLAMTVAVLRFRKRLD